ncbi:MAG: S8 family serine peptidase [Vicinamibacterales bacterium]
MAADRGFGRMPARLRAVAVLLAVAGVTIGDHVDLRAKDEIKGEYLLRVAPDDLASVAATYNLRVDPDRRDGDLYVVYDDDDRLEDALELEVGSDQDVQLFERNRELVLPEAQPDVQLNLSTAAILEQIPGGSVATFQGQTVWTPYVEQPALDTIKLDGARARGRTGGGIVAVIDTGIDPTHPALKDALVPGFDFTRNTAGTPSEFADLVPSTATLLQLSTAAILERDEVRAMNPATAAVLELSTAAILETLPQGDKPPAAFGHGTMAAGLVRLIAPDAKIMAIKAFRGDGSSDVFDLARAVYYAVDHGARVINMSFSLPSESKELKRALDYAESKGVVCLASAGNQGTKGDVFPAAWSHAIGIGSTTIADARSSFSNYGDHVFELAAPGEGLITAWPGGRYAAAWGTSFSTAVVAGGAALLVDPAVTPTTAAAVVEADVIDRALREAKKLGKDLGRGRIDLDAAAAFRGNFSSGGGTILPPDGDDDSDSMQNADELKFGLDPTRNDAAEDPDGDGRTNAQELAAGTHPRGFWKAYLAEGATSTFFSTAIALANPSTTTPAKVLLRYQPAFGANVGQFIDLPAHARRTIAVREDLADLATAEFSTVVESDLPIGIDRTMSWDASAYGSDAERGITVGPQTEWYFAEGATHSGFDLFYLVQNPGENDAQLEITFLRHAPLPPLVVTAAVPAATRRTIWVDTIPGLDASDVSAIIRSSNGVPVLVERAMYLNSGGRVFAAGHSAAAVPAPATRWFLAEGATGTFFDTFVLLANPDTRAAEVTLTFLVPAGAPIVQHYTVPAQSRFNVWVNVADPRLADTAVSTVVESTNGVPVVVERAMWWPRTGWMEAHNSAAATETGTRWILAEGEVGGAAGTETYVLVANTGDADGQARVTLLFEDGTTAAKLFPLTAQSRTNVAIASEFPQAANRRFGTLIESVGATPAPLVVERAMYANAGGVFWASGSNAAATKLP